MIRSRWPRRSSLLASLAVLTLLSGWGATSAPRTFARVPPPSPLPTAPVITDGQDDGFPDRPAPPNHATDVSLRGTRQVSTAQVPTAAHGVAVTGKSFVTGRNPFLLWIAVYLRLAP